MVADQTDERAASTGFGRPSRSLVRSLSAYAAKVELLRAAESRYRRVMALESQPPQGGAKNRAGAKRAAAKKANEAFDALAEAVVELKSSRAVVLAQAESEGVTPEAVCGFDEAFETADRRFAGYLSARTYGQLRDAVGSAPLS